MIKMVTIKSGYGGEMTLYEWKTLKVERFAWYRKPFHSFDTHRILIEHQGKTFWLTIDLSDKDTEQKAAWAINYAVYDRFYRKAEEDTFAKQITNLKSSEQL
jgi:predicted CoA-binding protein